MPAQKTVKAVWCGPFPAEIGSGVVLQPGDVHDVTPETLDSGHWTAVEPSVEPSVEPKPALARTEGVVG